MPNTGGPRKRNCLFSHSSRGDRKAKREEGTEALLKELDDDGPKYKRFGNVIELQKEGQAALVKLLKERTVWPLALER